MDLEPGAQITTNLRLARKLGQGGMGSVWVAEHLTLHTQLAVKFVSSALAMDSVAVERFGREASAAAQMKHPHVVQVFDHGLTHEGIPFIAMELLEGEDLGMRIDRLGRLDLAETAVILNQTCKALTRAHSLGLVHRDIKPDNIFLTDLEGEVFVKVLDFGIAKQTRADTKNMTSTGTMVGTPYYMSPEQATSAKHVDLRADLWSLAVVAYHCITGTVPFDGEMLGALFIAIDKAEFALPSTRVPGLPPAVDAWFTRALSRDPQRRFESAKEFAQAFEEAIRGVAPAPAAALGAPRGGDTAVLSPTGAVHAATLGGAAVTASGGRSGSRLALIGGVVVVSVLVVAGVAIGLSQAGKASATSDPSAITAASEAALPAAPDVGATAMQSAAAAPEPSAVPAAAEPSAASPTSPAPPVREPGHTAAKTPPPPETAAATPPKTAERPPAAPPTAANSKRDYGF